jgi:hypothetical protein
VVEAGENELTEGDSKQLGKAVVAKNGVRGLVEVGAGLVEPTVSAESQQRWQCCADVPLLIRGDSWRSEVCPTHPSVIEIVFEKLPRRLPRGCGLRLFQAGAKTHGGEGFVDAGMKHDHQESIDGGGASPNSATSMRRAWGAGTSRSK